MAAEVVRAVFCDHMDDLAPTLLFLEALPFEDMRSEAMPPEDAVPRASAPPPLYPDALQRLGITSHNERAMSDMILFAASLLTRISLGFLLLCTLLPLLPVGAWFVRLCDFPRIQFAVATLIPLAGICVWTQYTAWNREHTFLMICIVGIVVWQFSHVWRYTPLWPKELPDARVGGEAHEAIMLAVANVQFENEQRVATRQRLEQLGADVLLLVEVDRKWDQALRPLRELYPYYRGVVRENGLGMQLYSRLPLRNDEIKYLVSEKRPSIHCEVQVEPNHWLHLIGVHPTPPGLSAPEEGDRHDSRIRDAELMLIAQHIADHPDATWLVTGDFNDVAWSHTTRVFKRLSGLKDPRIGRGLYNTYHAQSKLLRFPIDHVFVSSSARMHQLKRFRPPGSDHFGIIAEFSLAYETHAQSTADTETRDEAEEMVEEGVEDAAEREKQPTANTD